MRVLHLIDDVADQACGTTLAMLADAQGRIEAAEQTIVLLGGQRLNDAAIASGVRGAVRLGVPRGNAILGLLPMQRWIRSQAPFDLVHCWSITTLSLAAVLLRHVPRMFTLTQTPSRRAVHWLRILTSESAGKTLLLPISATIRRELMTGGIAEAAAVLLRPGLDMARVAMNARGELRESWKIDDPDRKIVALLCDPAHAADAIQAGLAVGLADEILRDHQITLSLLVHPLQSRRLRAENNMRQIQRPGRFVRDARCEQPWSVLGGCDIALALGPHAGGLSLLWAMAANVPIVAEANYAISEIVEDRHSALLARPNEPRHLAYRITQILEDAQLAWKLRDTARHEAYSFFSRQRYCQLLHRVYTQTLAGQTIDLPPLEATGGLRFAGRA